MKLNGMLLKSTVIAALVAAPVAPVMAQTMQDDPRYNDVIQDDFNIKNIGIDGAKLIGGW